jgi:hypothetical protein
MRVLTRRLVLLAFNTEADVMTAERTEELPEPRASSKLPVTVSVSVAGDGRQGTDPDQKDSTSEDKRTDSTRRETADSATNGDDRPNKEQGPPAQKLSPAKVKMRGDLPALADDADVGVQKEYIVTRDGKADLRFTGVLLASAAPASAPEGHWEEYRIYQTSGGKHVFSRVARSVLEKDEDTHEADVFDPSPSSVPSQLMRSAREIARARPLTWMDAAVAFFGYSPLAKALYRKLSVRFEEEIT